MPTAKRKPEPAQLKGWQNIAQFLGQPIAVAQRWGKSGMPVSRQGRHMTANPDDLRRWLAKESGAAQPVTIASANADLAADLKRGLTEARRQRRIHRIK